MITRLFRSSSVKPNLGAAIDWTHPIARGLVACFICNETTGSLIDLVGGYTVPLTGSGKHAAYNWGTGLDCSQANDSGARITAWQRLRSIPVNEEVTLLWRGKIATGASAFGGLFGVSFGSGAPFSCYQLQLGDTGGKIVLDWNSGGIQNQLITTPAVAYDNSERQFVGIIRGLGALSEMWEGTSRINSVNANFGPTFDAGSGLEIGTLRASAGVNSKSQFRHGYIWHRALSSDEIKQLYQEPYIFIYRPFYWSQTEPPAATRTASDTLALSDSISTSLGLDFTDTLALSDAVSVGLGILVRDQLQFLDNALIATNSGFELEVTDALALTDSLATSSTYAAGLSDTLALTDSVTVGRGYDGFGDTFTFTDAVSISVGSVFLDVTAAVSDTIALFDSIQLATQGFVAVGDSVNLQDFIQVNLQSGRTSYLRRYLNDVVN